MAEPEDMTLRLLREMRERFDGVEATLREHTSRFDHLDEQIEAMSGYVTWSMGSQRKTGRISRASWPRLTISNPDSRLSRTRLRKT